MRLWLFLYSTSNILGCAFGLLGPLLLLTGHIEAWWLPITLGLYAAGYLLGLGRGAPELQDHIEHTLSVEQTLARFDALVRGAHPHLTDDQREHLKRIRASVAEVLPRLLAVSGVGDELFTVRETVLRYVPQTLANYVSLPPAFRVTHALKDGKTARQLLSEQLELLDSKLAEIVANVATRDARALLENGRFLELKFNSQSSFFSS